jgi:hypothetical protein
VAKGVDELQVMLNDLAAMLYDKLDLHLKPSDSKWLANPSALSIWEQNGCPHVTVPALGDRASFETEKVDVMRILGVFTDNLGRTAVAVDHRLGAGQRKWATSRRHLCCKNRSLRERFRRFYDTVGLSVLWGASGWNLGTDEARKLDSFELQCQRQMVGVPRKPEEDWVHYLRRVNNVVRALRKRWHFPSLAERATALAHRWIGHVHRLELERPVRQALHHRSLQWWHFQTAAGFQLDRYNAEGWKHPKGGYYRMFERQFHQAGLSDWPSLATDRMAWKRTESKFVRNKVQKLRKSRTAQDNGGSETFETFEKLPSAIYQEAFSSTVSADNIHQGAGVVTDLPNTLRERFRRARSSEHFQWPAFLATGDNSSVCKTLAGQCRCRRLHPHVPGTRSIDEDWGARAVRDLHKLYKSFGLQPPPGERGSFQWRPRAQNTLADSLANRALDVGNVLDIFHENFKEMVQSMVRGSMGGVGEDDCVGWLWARFDGAARVLEGSGEGESSFGVSIDWVRGQSRLPIFRESWRLGRGSAFRAELRGAARATHILLSIYTRLAAIT